MRLTARQYANILVDFLEKNPPDCEIAASFLTILRKNRQEKLLSRIFFIAEEIWKEKNGVVDIAVKTAALLSDSEQEILKKSFEKRGKNVVIHQTVIPDLRGGAQIR